MKSTIERATCGHCLVRKHKWEYASEDGEDYEWEYSDEEGVENKEKEKNDEKKEEDEKEKKEKEEDEEEEEEEEEEDELELEDIDLPDPFSSEPIPTIKPDKKINGTTDSNGVGEEEEKKKKHRKKSKHHDKFEKFRKLEEKGSKGEEFRSKKIHVRSKDPSKIARQFENGSKEKEKGPRKSYISGREAPKPKPVEIIKLCKICGKEPYLVERIVAEKSWWHKNCFRCTDCKKTLNLDTYSSHQGVIYCKPHHRELFQPKPVLMDLTEEIMKKNLDFSMEDPIERHRNQERKMETIVRENKPVSLEGVVKSRVDDSKWEGLDKLDVGSKFLMFEKGMSEEREHKVASDRYGIMEKLKRLEAGEAVEDLLAEIDEEMPSMSEDEEDDDEDTGLTQVQKKAQNAEKMFVEDSRKEKLQQQRKKELKNLRDRLMAGTRDSILDSFDEISHKKIKKTQIDVRSENAKKFMSMFNKGEIPEGISATDRYQVSNMVGRLDYVLLTNESYLK
ncbi:glutamic acid-rich protein [Eurytemora carolleeae]|uniref:glutamic acid-rich protein n=1 Tax=Eurytemora carolleeae TaxID=1294199 RepID=UPI000C77B13E|nr:glutamic acid-rich protein [Eurytemora carolleeae]|eukprot:XP_023330930.1 glutamic acid-rich protein-like [Eurytemora affinis]